MATRIAVPRTAPTWRKAALTALAVALRNEGVSAKDAETFAGLVVSTVEGTLLRARAAGSQEPLDSAIGGLEQALDSPLAR